MKIVFATDFYFPHIGGIEVTTRRLSQELSKAGHEVFIIAPSRTRKNEIFNDGKVTVMGVDSIPTPFYKGLRSSFKVLANKRIAKILSEINPDIIHIQTNLGIAQAASNYAIKNNIPFVATGHFMAEDFVRTLKIPERYWNLVNRLSWSFSSSIWSRANLFTVPTATAAKYFSSKLNSEKEVLTISNGIDTNKFNINHSKPRKIARIAVIGRLDLAKRVDVVIRAIPEIVKKMEIKLIVVGDGLESNNLKKLVNELGINKYVEFKGFLPEEKVIEIYRQSDLLVTASVIETQGIVLLEALACGIPVVAANAGAIPELIKHGKNGLLFQPENSHALAECVLKILSNKSLWLKMSAQSIKISKEHDMQNVVMQMQFAYQKAIAANKLQILDNFARRQIITRSLAIKTILTLIIVAILFKNAPGGVAKAKNIRISDRIKNLRVVKSIEKLDTDLKNHMPKNLIK